MCNKREWISYVLMYYSILCVFDGIRTEIVKADYGVFRYIELDTNKVMKRCFGKIEKYCSQYKFKFLLEMIKITTFEYIYKRLEEV